MHPERDPIHLSFFADAFRDSPAPAIILLSDGRVQFWNAAAERVFGWAAEEVIGNPLPFIPPEKVEEHRKFRQQDLSGAGLTGVRIRRRRKDGQWIDLSVSTAPIRDSDGRVMGIISIYADITPEKHRISELAELSEELGRQKTELRLVIDGIPGIVAYIDRDYRFKFVNRSLTEWFQRPGSEIEGRALADLVGPELVDLARPNLDRALAGEPVVLEREFTFADRARTVRARYLPDHLPDGSVRGLVVLVEDITSEARALRSLRESEEKFRQIVETATEGIWIVDPHGITTFVNGRMCEMVGYPESELIGRCCFDIIHPDDRPRGTAAFESRKHGDTRGREYRVLRKNGEMIWLRFSGAPLHDASGALTGVLGMCTDITERKYEEARYQALFATSEDGILIVNGSGIYVDVNPAYCDLLKTTRDQLIGSAFAPYIPPDRLPDAEAAFRTLIETGRYEGEFPLLATDGTVVDLEWRSIGNFVPGLHCCIARDIRDRKRFEMQLQQTQKLESLGVMAGGIAHDFNNLLVGILGNASLALDASRDRSVTPMLQDVVTAGERAAALIRQMLAYAGQGRHEAKRVDVAALIEETVTLLKATIPKTVTLDLELQHASVEADPAQLQQVVMNMVINAAEAIPEGRPGHVLVSSSTRRLGAADQARSIVPIELGNMEYVEICFTDTGTGIPPELQRRIFDPFFTTKFAGRGLGLSAVLGIVRSHGGTLTLESQPGKGTTFRILLPAVAAGIAPAATGKPAAFVAPGTTILVVDDEETVRSAARRALERYGYSVCVAGNGREAIAAVCENPAISAVVLDLAMPELTGDQVAPLLRAQRPGLRIIGSSGYSESEAIRRFGGVHIRAFLQKPYTAHSLVEKVTAVVGNGGSQA